MPQNHSSWMSSLIAQLFGRAPEPSGYLQQRQMGHDQSRSDVTPTRTPFWKDADDVAGQPDIASHARGGEVPPSGPRDYPRLPRDAVTDIERPGAFYPSRSMGLTSEGVGTRGLGEPQGAGRFSPSMPLDYPMPAYEGGNTTLDWIGDVLSGRRGFADGGAPRSPVPDWLLDQQAAARESEGIERSEDQGPGILDRPWMGPRGDKSVRDFGRRLWEETRSDPSLPVSMTGIPSIAAGIESLTDAEADGWTKAKGAGQVAAGALPAMSALRSTAPIAEAMTSTFPRLMGLSYAASDAPREAAGLIEEALRISQAQAQGRKGGAKAPPAQGDFEKKVGMEIEPLTTEQARSRQQILQKNGFPDIKVDGAWKEGSQEAWNAYQGRLKGESEKAEDARRKTQLEAETAASRAKAEEMGLRQKEEDRKKAEKEAEQAALAAEEKKRNIISERETKGQQELGYWQSAKRQAPAILGATMGGLFGKGLGYLVGKTFETPGKITQYRVNNMLDKTPGGTTDPALSKQVAAVNETWRLGGGGGKEPFRTNPKAVPPFSSREGARPSKLDPKPEVMPVNKLFPEKGISGFEKGLQTIGTAAPLVETGLAYQSLEPAKAELAAASAEWNKNPTETNYQRYQKALDDEASARFMISGSIATTLGYGSGAGLAAHNRGSQRPEVHKAEAIRQNLEGYLAKQQAAAKAAKAAKAAAATPPPGPGASPPTPKAPTKKKKSLAPLLPLAGAPAAEWLLGSPSPEQVSQLDAPLAEMATAADTQPTSDIEEPPFKDGGSIAKHHSRFQPRAVDGKWTGGPVYPALKRYMGGGVPARKAETKQDTGRALDLARRYATGGAVHAGPVVGATGGRTDALPISVEAGSYVVSADVVSALGEGNSLAGFKALEKMFGKPSGVRGAPVDIKISDGEFVISPSQVAKVGGGDIQQGHKALDQWMRRARAANVKNLSQLPPPAR